MAARLARFPHAAGTPIDTCFYAWRLLKCRQRYEDIVVPAEELHDVAEDLRRCLKSFEHAFARMLLTLLAIEGGDYRGALIEITELGRLHGGAADKAPMIIVEAGIRIVRAGQTTGEERKDLLTTGWHLAKAGLEMNPGYTRRFYSDIRKADLQIRLQWIDTATDDHWSKRPPFDRYLLNFMAHTIKDLSAKLDVDKVVWVGSRAESRPELAHLVGEPDYPLFEQYHLWALRRKRDALEPAREIAEARELAARARNAVDRLRRASIEIPYALRVEDGVAEGFVARTDANLANRRKLVQDALEHLQKLDDDGVLTEAQKHLSEQKRESLAKLRARCVYEIELLREFLNPESQPESR